ncbi:TetR/AcrR family transcriptional regulator [Sporolactobacillus shoreae]|uniref:TetR/AcrR family transcriptional regulator n=1 Tax=Sporolactobacillus shoreae TaxID=1465501 RepID=A0A4Z0GNG7_9BACL|nr:TetR/AcrR family transcriptional regulator [Sporolactobacillus shoreae]TGA98450.1 TetR/AcrR family transcriptional regulator [Sporolactobacillus shoreae]
MYQKSTLTKNNIMLAVVNLLQDREVEQISIVDIAKEANVAVGLINYHFKSKEELFRLAVEYYIRKTITEESRNVTSLGLTPREQLAISIKGYADFIERHKRLSRYYLLYLLENVIDAESSNLGYDYYIPLLKELKKGCAEEDLVLYICQIIHPIQMMFLRNDIMKKAVKLDFSCKKDRDVIIEKLISNIVD